MIQKSAKVTQSSETRVHIVERGCREGLNIGHLRAFVQQADIAGLDDNTHVWLTDKLQATSPYHDVEIAASVKESHADDIAQERDAAEKHARMRASESEDLERERDALAAEVDRLQLVHAGQARLALSAIFLADVDDDEGTQAFVDEWKRHHAAQALRDAAERWDWTEVPGGAPPVDRWLRAEADRLAPKAPDHNEQEQR